ncbi:MAG: DUF3800 domain-containing protein [Geobacteraceae bacterium]|nr:DUF3800 domain-containing protein [Geobacteraceae bacterium]
MNIFIDESGSFVSAPRRGTWNAVAAFVSSEPDRKLKTVLNKLKRRCRDNFSEIKLKDIDESDYFQFLQEIAALEGALFCTATDAGCNDLDTLKRHQEQQAEAVLTHVDKMKYEGGREALQILSKQLANLSPQLYAQLYCQVHLINDTVSRMIPFFVQRNPRTLSMFRWRVDQKNTSKTELEEAFEKITPALLQTMSIDKPLIMIRGLDYSYMADFIFKDDETPEYLSEVYGINVESSINIQKIIRADMKFIDSKESVGIQVADLLASGIRRCLRGGFQKNDKAASLLGRLMVQAVQNRPPLNLIGFKDGVVEEEHTRNAVKNMIMSCQPMMKRANTR